MGLYSDRLAASESRFTERVAQRRSFSALRPKNGATMGAPSKRSMRVQSLLFNRADGWTVEKAKAWAKSHGYKHGKADVTTQYVRLRQFDPKGKKVNRTITFGRGIRAVVAREGVNSMAKTTVKASRRRRSKKSGGRKRARRVRSTTKVQARRAAPKHRRRRRVRAAAPVVAAPRRRRRRRASHVMEAPRRRKRRVRRVRAWRGDADGHRKAARKGWRRKRSASAAPRRRRRRVHSTAYAAAPRKRRRSHRRRARETSYATESRRTHRRRSHRRRHYGREASRGGGFDGAELAMAVLSGGIGFVAADALDRFLATYDPSSTNAPDPNKFTSSGTGALGNALNVASRPGLLRVGAGVGVTALPAIASMFVKGPMLKSSLEGMTVGMGVNLFRLLFNNFLMPMLVPTNADATALKSSHIARLYPAEVAARINMAARTPASGSTPAGPPPAPGVLSGTSPDVGPFALAAAGDSQFPTAQEVLSARAGVQGYPTVQETYGTGGPGSDYPTVQQLMRQHEAGMSGGNPGQPGVSAWQPGPPTPPGPGPKAEPHTDPQCGCMGVGDEFAGFLGDAPEATPTFDLS